VENAEQQVRSISEAMEEMEEAMLRSHTVEEAFREIKRLAKNATRGAKERYICINAASAFGEWPAFYAVGPRGELVLVAGTRAKDNYPGVKTALEFNGKTYEEAMDEIEKINKDKQDLGDGSHTSTFSVRVEDVAAEELPQRILGELWRNEWNWYPEVPGSGGEEID